MHCLPGLRDRGHRDLAAVHEQPSRHRDRASAVLASLGRVPPAHPWPHWSALGGVCMPSRGRGLLLARLLTNGDRDLLASILVRGQRAWPISSSTKKRSAPPTWSVRLSTVTHAVRITDARLEHITLD